MNRNLEKGIEFEELLRAYFLRSGMYVVRSIPIIRQGFDLSDIDIWLYDKPTGLSRRVQILDAKFKSKPKAIDRIFWTKGISELLNVDGAYIATTDKRSLVKYIGRDLGMSVLDGNDLNRLNKSNKIFFPDRLKEEEFTSFINTIDKAKHNKKLSIIYKELKSALIEKFGVGSINRALNTFSYLVSKCIESHPNSDAANIYIRLAYFSASIVLISIDFCLSKVSLRGLDEQKTTLANIIRYGNEDVSNGLEKIRIASALIEKYLPNGRALSQTMLNDINQDYKSINAEMIVEHVINKKDSLYTLGCNLEMKAFSRELCGFDDLSIDEKSFLGTLIDFSELQRNRFAESWYK